MDPEQTATSHPSWSELTGVVLPGGYEVAELIAADPEKSRFRVRVLGDWSANAFVDAFALSGSAAGAQLAAWIAAQQMQHPNLSSPLASGELELDGLPVLYVVASSPDETLAGLLGERPATVSEALEFLQSVRAALSYLHAYGWTHGHLSPEQVFAFGDSIRLSTEHLVQTNSVVTGQLLVPKYVAPEGSEANLTPAADVWCLGATLFEALTQRDFSMDRFAELVDLPTPFDRVVTRCLDPDPQARCTLAEIEGLLSAPRQPAAITVPKVHLTAPERAVESATPVLARATARHKREETSFPKFWLYAAGVLIIASLVLWSARARHRDTVANVPASPSAASSMPGLTHKSAPNTASPTRILQPVKPVPVRAQTDSAPANNVAGVPDHTVNGSVWRVVLFTYSHEADAEKKAHSVNQKHPQLDATVFKPSGAHPAYLVTVGGRMTREQAARLRQRVIGLGLPRDSYIQNYKQ